MKPPFGLFRPRRKIMAAYDVTILRFKTVKKDAFFSIKGMLSLEANSPDASDNLEPVPVLNSHPYDP